MSSTCFFRNEFQIKEFETHLIFESSSVVYECSLHEARWQLFQAKQSLYLLNLMKAMAPDGSHDPGYADKERKT